MDKNDILKKSRAEKRDEGITFFGREAMIWGTVGMHLVLFSLIFVSLFNDVRCNQLQAILFAYQGCHYLACFRRNKRIIELIVGVLGLLACILSCYIYIREVVG